MTWSSALSTAEQAAIYTAVGALVGAGVAWLLAKVTKAVPRLRAAWREHTENQRAILRALGDDRTERFS